MKKLLMSLIFITSLSSLTIKAMEKIETAEEETYQPSAQEQELERHRIVNLACHLCPIDGPPKLGVPLVGQLMQNNVISEMTPEERDFLLQASIKYNKDTVLHWHERYHRALFIKYGATLTKKNQTFLLHNAVELGDYMLVKFLLQHGIDPNIQSPHTYSQIPLFSARSLPLVKLLVAYGANLHVRNKDGALAFHIAISSPKSPVNLIRYYMKQGIAIDSITNYHNSALHFIASNLNTNESDNHTMIQKADFILCAGIPLDIRNEGKQTAEDYLISMLERIDKEKLHNPSETQFYIIKENAIKQVLALINNERNTRTMLLQPWHTFCIGWYSDIDAVHHCLPIELMYNIYEFFKASIFKGRINNWISKNNLN